MNEMENTASGQENLGITPSAGDDSQMTLSRSGLADRIFEQVLNFESTISDDQEEMIRNRQSVRNRLILARLLMMADDMTENIVDTSYTESLNMSLHPDSTRTLDKSYTQKYDKHDQEQCRICQENFIKDDKIATLQCNHIFHTSCLEEWVKRKATCPFCITPINYENVSK